MAKFSAENSKLQLQTDWEEVVYGCHPPFPSLLRLVVATCAGGQMQIVNGNADCETTSRGACLIACNLFKSMQSYQCAHT